MDSPLFVRRAPPAINRILHITRPANSARKITQITELFDVGEDTVTPLYAARLRLEINLQAANPKSAQADWIARFSRLQTALDG